MDTISLLPDEILGHILSFLPTKQAASTSLLSKRWRHVFLLVSTLDLHYDDRIDLEESLRSGLYDVMVKARLSLYDNVLKVHRSLYDNVPKARRSLYDKRREFMDFVESLLSRQGKSPIKKLTLKTYGCDLDRTRVQSWIRNVLERGVVDLNLFYKEKDQHLSSLIFKNNTLVKLTLGGGFESILSQDVYLPKLKTLCLDSVVSDGVFETLLPRCPVLEELVIQSLVKGGSVSSRSLKKLTIRFSMFVQTISLDVPNLIYMELPYIFGVTCVNVNLDSLVEARLNLIVFPVELEEQRRGSADLFPADKVDIITQIRNVKVLHLTSDVLEMFYFSGQELPRFHNLVRLCIFTRMNQGWQILPLLIRNSPNLETLIFKGLDHYQTTSCGDVCVCTGSKENSLSCLSSCRIKVLEIWFYKGTSKEVNQMKHFLEKLPCLELVKIKAVDNLQVPIFIQQLLELPRASSNCKFQAIL